MGIDHAKNEFDHLARAWSAQQALIETEQDARFQVIDRMLTSVLGWNYKDIKTEPPTESGFIDYLITHQGRNRFVVEAKRLSRLLVDTRNPNAAAYKASGPAIASAADGLAQAKRYCADSGVLFAALTTGFEWVAYWAIRTDGTRPADGKAIVFPSLQAIAEKFAWFYDLFSREGILQNLYQVRIREVEGLEVQHVETLEPTLRASDITLRPKTSLASDLGSIYRGFFSTISGEKDPEMLARCFVESRESREADISLTKIAQNLINRIEVVNSSEAAELQSQIEAALETHQGEFVLIIGNKGAGKSTFIDRFFRLVLDKRLREKCLILRIDLADSDGNSETIAPWLTERLKNQLEGALFEGQYPTYEQLQGVFFHEYQRWQYGERKYLYERDRNEFKEKFGEWIAALIESHPDQYVTELLQHAVSARKLMPCLVFDNPDHFRQDFQESVFQFAQSIFRSSFSFVICPITDCTIWQLSKSGPLQSYETRVFYLPVPSTKEVLSKRIEFIKEKTIGETNEAKGEYFLSKGIRLQIGDIRAFAACVEDLFISEDYVGRDIGWLSNHDIRRSLQIAERIITSPTIKIEDLVKTYLVGSKESIPRERITEALLVGDYNFFKQSESHFILNLFSVSPDGVTSPLTKMSILRLLMDKDFEPNESDKSYVAVGDILNYLEPARLSRVVVKNHLTELLSYRLVEPYDPTDTDIYEDQRIRVTHCGRVHWEFAFARQNASYMSQMALTTPLRDYSLVSRMREQLKKPRKQRDDWLKIVSWFAEYCLQQDRLFFELPRIGIYEGQIKFREEFRRTWIDAQ